VPQAVAYAQIAGLPPSAGLAAAPDALLAYALLGTSRSLVVSATTATSALSAAAVGPLASGDAARFAALSAGHTGIASTRTVTSWRSAGRTCFPGSRRGLRPVRRCEPDHGRRARRRQDAARLARRRRAGLAHRRPRRPPRGLVDRAASDGRERRWPAVLCQRRQREGAPARPRRRNRAAAEAVVLELAESPDLDLETLDILGDLDDAPIALGVELRLAGVRTPALGLLRRSGLADRLRIEQTLDAAVRR
jgi:Sulfate permease family